MKYYVLYMIRRGKKRKKIPKIQKKEKVLELKREIVIKRTKRRKGAKEQNGKEKYGKGNKRNNSA